MLPLLQLLRHPLIGVHGWINQYCASLSATHSMQPTDRIMTPEATERTPHHRANRLLCQDLIDGCPLRRHSGRLLLNNEL
jgi:hypothetical protein